MAGSTDRSPGDPGSLRRVRGRRVLINESLAARRQVLNKLVPERGLFVFLEKTFRQLPARRGIQRSPGTR